MLLQIYHFFFNQLRVSDPWKYKTPTLISIPYFFVVIGNIMLADTLIYISLSFTTILGIAAFGYFLNDFSDMAEDKARGKRNAMANLQQWQRVAILTGILLLAFAPWYYLPLNQYSLGLLLSQFGWFILYSLPPFRFKERHFLGVLADAMYAHVTPALLAAITFILIISATIEQYTYYLLTLGIWQLFLGLRNIVLHQIADYEADVETNTHTYVVQIGQPQAKRLLLYWFLPVEIISVGVLLACMSIQLPYFISLYPIFMVYTLLKYKVVKKDSLPTKLRQKVYVYVDDFYSLWLPIGLLGLACWHNYYLVLLLLLHLLLFKNALGDIWQTLKTYW